MSMYAWNDRLSVSIKEIDDQHKKLVGLLNRLYEAMMARRGDEAVMGMVEEMKRYAETHFATEERHMRAHAYPELAPHKAEHDSFVVKAAQVGEDWQAGKCAMSVDIIAFLTRWLLEHIKVTDRKFGPYLNERGVR